MTIGSPFGLEQSVATGIVSATSRSQIVNASTDQYGNSTGESTIYPNMIQTDAAINPVTPAARSSTRTASSSASTR